jgi:D-alanine-D-alanine ligase
MKKNIALVAGGYSGEYAISVKSAVTIENNLDAEKYNVYKIIIDKNNWKHTTALGEKIEIDRQDFSLNIHNEKIKFDAVFIGIHGTPGEDGKLQGYFEMLEIPFTSCGAITSGFTFNKIYCNRIVAQSGLVHVAKSAHLFKEEKYTPQDILQKVKLPVFVKPVEGGSSLATFKINDESELMPAIAKGFEVDTQVMAEEFIKGRECTIGIYKLNGTLYDLPITEVISKKEFFDYEAKYTPGMSEEVTPADFTEKLSSDIANIAKKLYSYLNCKGVVRIDFIIEAETNHIYFLEVNTMPGQSENSIIPQQVKANGGNLREFYGSLIEECLR